MEVIYRLIFFKDALKDINYWKKSGNKQASNKIQKILEVLEQNPHGPTPGEPEMLKYTTGYSRRITKKDRITYDINDVTKEVIIFRMRGHYNDK
jgi:toxin YoeB